jgi:hypothetical protein
MKKEVLILSLGLLLAAAPLAGGNDLRQYVGRYAFSLENLVETVEITFRNDSTLMAVTPLGQITLTPAGDDRFEFPQYGGVVVFQRNEKQEITDCLISVAALDVEKIKARKQ